MKYLIIPAFLAVTNCAFPQNPVIPGKGVADPHVSIFNGRAYMYASHDYTPQSKNYDMRDWWAWSSDDLVNWKWECTLKPDQTYIKKPYNCCFAGFCVTKNDKYYWYYSICSNNIGVVVGDTPAGPWKEGIGKPLIYAGMTPILAHDPDILMDDDGSAYMVFGYHDYYIVKLNEDMISLSEKPQLVSVDLKINEYGPVGELSDKPSLHKRNGLYYLTWGGFYAVSKNVYGPFNFRGSIVSYKGSMTPDEMIAPEFRKTNDIWPINFDRHGNHFTWHNQWFFTCNDKSMPGSTAHFRDPIISYVHYRDNGDMAPIRIDRIGVGQYEATQERIEAEDYFASEKVEVKEIPGDGPGLAFEIRGVSEASSLYYPKVKDLPENATLALCVASTNKSITTIEIREDNVNGKILGTCSVASTGGSNKYQALFCPLKNKAGTKNLLFTFKGKGKDLIRFDYWNVIKSVS